MFEWLGLHLLLKFISMNVFFLILRFFTFVFRLLYILSFLMLTITSEPFESPTFIVIVRLRVDPWLISVWDSLISMYSVKFIGLDVNTLDAVVDGDVESPLMSWIDSKCRTMLSSPTLPGVFFSVDSKCRIMLSVPTLPGVVISVDSKCRRMLFFPTVSGGVVILRIDFFKRSSIFCNSRRILLYKIPGFSVKFKQLLCILTSKWVLRTPFAGQNQFFDTETSLTEQNNFYYR